MADEENAWYYCLTHKTIEHGVGCRGGDRMGPYPDEATASRALDIARAKTAAADDAARKWDDD